jgi:hypothetical protein
MMTKIELEAWLKRADEILGQQRAAYYGAAGEVYQFATSMVSTVYGADSPQMRALQANAEAISKAKTGSPPGELFDLSQGVIKNTKAELEAGLAKNWRSLVAGELLAELVRLGKEILSEGTEAAKNVSAVLISAAFEGVLRRMDEELAGQTGRPPLHEVVTHLKTAGVLQGGQVHTASSYLKFRNDSLHADWQKVDRSQVEGCTLFVESLLGRHFS